MFSYDTIREVWKRSGSHVGFIAYKEKLQGTDRWFDIPTMFMAESPENTHQWHGHDMFFSPLTFTVGKRANENVHKPGVLFADLDPVDPSDLDVRPTMAWETSPGSYQAIWFLEDPIEDYDEWANLNQRLTGWSGADKGGWMGSKVLRWPGTLNWKRKYGDNVPLGRGLWYEPESAYPVSWFKGYLPELPRKVVVATRDHPPIVPHPEYVLYVRKHWQDLTLKGQSMLRQQRVGDRSLHIVRTAYELAKTLEPDVVFNLLYHAGFQKWQNRPERLWEEVLRAAEE